MHSQMTHTRQPAIRYEYAGVLLFCLAVLLVSPGVMAHCKGKHAPPHEHCDPIPPEPSGSLAAAFDLVMTDSFPGLSSDSVSTVYVDDKKKNVRIGTGSGPGLRFDTRYSGKSAVRHAHLDFDGFDGLVDVWSEVAGDGGTAGSKLSTLYSGDYDIDLRFNLTNGGLELGDMVPTDVRYVPIDLWVSSSSGDRFALAYSENADPLTNGALVGNTCVLDFTRNAEVTMLSSDSWLIKSHPDDGDACLFDFNAGVFNQMGTVVNMPFEFVITIQD